MIISFFYDVYELIWSKCCTNSLRKLSVAGEYHINIKLMNYRIRDTVEGIDMLAVNSPTRKGWIAGKL